MEVLGVAAGPEAPHHNRRERAVLSALLLLRPAAVAPDVIADAVWSGTPPPTWAKQIQAAVGRLRATLGTAAIATVGRSYRLELPRGTVDADVFEDELARATALRLDGEHGRAAVALERALGLWRSDEPYEAVSDWPPATAEIERLIELRRQAEDDLLAERLAAGDHRGVAATAAALAAAEPLRESRWISLATALYRCERQADALAAIARARAHLRDQLGLDPSTALVDLEGAILRHDPDLSAAPSFSTADDACPYKGLSAYEAGDAEVYFGRDADIAHAIATLDRMRFLVLAGASGTGKSSLLRAGIQPALAARGATVVAVTASGPGVEAITRAPAHATIAIDQFEAAYSPAAPAGQVRALCDALAAHHRRGGSVAIALRSDHLDACAADSAIGPLVRSSLDLVAPLRADGLRAAIEEPARYAHLTLEHGFTDVVLADAEAASGALPLLSHALAETWQRREGSTLTIDGYTSSGGLRGAVARSAEQLFTNLTEPDRRRCEMILRRLVTLTDAGAVVSHPVDARTLADADLERVVARLVHARLVGSREHHLELAHESLVHAWPRLQSWLEADVEGQRVLGHLSTAAVTWDSLGRPAQELYRGPRLALAWDWVENDADALTPLEHTFLVSSRTAEEAARTAEEEAERRESRARARVRAMRRWAVAAALAAVVGAIAATVAGQRAATSDRAERAQTERAHLEAVTRDFASVMDHSRTMGLLLAAEAFRRWPDEVSTQGALLTALATEPGYLGDLYLDEDRAPQAAMVGDGTTAVLATPGGIDVLDLRSGTVKAEVASSVDWAWPLTPDIAAAADGSRAVLVSHTSATKSSVGWRLTFASYDLETGEELAVRRIGGERARAGSLAVSPDGALAAVIDERRGDVTVRDVATGRLTGRVNVAAPTGGAAASPGAVAFLDSDTALVTTRDGRVLVVDAHDATVTRTFTVPEGYANVAVAVARDGTAIAAGDKGVVALPSTPSAPAWAQEHAVADPGACRALALATATGAVLCGSDAGVIREYDLLTGTPTATVRATQHGAIEMLAVAAEGTMLVAVSADAPAVTRWSLDGSGPITTVVAAGRQAVDRWSADGTALITRPRDPSAGGRHRDRDRAWDIATDDAVRVLPRDLESLAWWGAGGVVGRSRTTGTYDAYDVSTGRAIAQDVVPADASSVSFSPDRTRVYALFDDRTVETYDAGTLRRIGPEIRTLGAPRHVSASADGGLIAVTSELDYGPIVQFLDGETGAMVGLPRNAWRNVALAPDGSGVAIHDSTQSVRHFDETRTEDAEPIPTGAPIDALEFSADGTRFLVSAHDGRVTLYETGTGERIGTALEASSPGTVAGLLRPDGLAIAVNVDQGVAIWDLDPDHMLVAACKAAGRNLSWDEWSTYLSDVGAWRATCPGYPRPASW